MTKDSPVSQLSISFMNIGGELVGRYRSVISPNTMLEIGFTMDTFRAEVKKLLAANEPDKPIAPTSSNEETIWNFLTGKGLNAYAVAGVMGNLYAESALRPDNLQNSYEKSLGYTDDRYTAAVDNGSYTNFVKDGAGYGLAQWTFWSRKQALLDFARTAGKSIGDLAMQLDFMWKELQQYTAVFATLKAATSAKQASDVMLTGYEKPADQSDAVKIKRAGYGQGYYDKYKKVQTPAAPNILYRVQVGAYSVKANADATLAKVKAAGFIDAFIKTE